MVERAESLTKKNLNDNWIGTIHSMALRLLKSFDGLSKFGFKSNIETINAQKQIKVIFIILKKDEDLNAEVKKLIKYKYVEEIAKTINKFKNYAVSSTFKVDLMKSIIPNFTEAEEFIFVKVYPVYQKFIKALNMIDFGDMILYNLILFKINSDYLNLI